VIIGDRKKRGQHKGEKRGLRKKRKKGTNLLISLYRRGITPHLG
jgi:hypothetical protein